MLLAEKPKTQKQKPDNNNGPNRIESLYTAIAMIIVVICIYYFYQQLQAKPDNDPQILQRYEYDDLGIQSTEDLHNFRISIFTNLPSATVQDLITSFPELDLQTLLYGDLNVALNLIKSPSFQNALEDLEVPDATNPGRLIEATPSSSDSLTDFEDMEQKIIDQLETLDSVYKAIHKLAEDNPDIPELQNAVREIEKTGDFSDETMRKLLDITFSESARQRLKDRLANNKPISDEELNTLIEQHLKEMNQKIYDAVERYTNNAFAIRLIKANLQKQGYNVGKLYRDYLQFKNQQASQTLQNDFKKIIAGAYGPTNVF